MQKYITCIVTQCQLSFAANYQYLSFTFGLTEADWYTSLDHLLSKVKKKKNSTITSTTSIMWI